jgi:hypothetical protein
VRTIDAAQQGILPGLAHDSGAALSALLAASKGDVRVVLRPGRYQLIADASAERCWMLSNTEDRNPRRIGILLSGLCGVELDLRGVELCCHGRMMPLAIDGCQDITVRGGSIDWLRPMTAQAEVLAADGTQLDLALDSHIYPHCIEDGRLVFAADGWRGTWWGVLEFDPDSNELPPGSGDDCLGWRWRDHSIADIGSTADGRRHLQVQGAFERRPKPGNILVLRHGVRDHAGVLIRESQRVTVLGLRLHHTSGLGILGQHSTDLDFREVAIVPSAGRVFSSHDDGFHFSNCRGRISLTENIHGTAVRITAIHGTRTVQLRFMHPESVGLDVLRPGDRIAYLCRRSLRPLAEAQVVTVQAWGSRDLICVVDADLPATVGLDDAVENLTWTPAVEITGCDFGRGRARGILVSTPGAVRIADNHFATAGSAILVAGDANQWYETGAVHDVEISRNRFSATCNRNDFQFCHAVISICPEIPVPDPAAPYHRGIRILDNHFELADRALLYAFSCTGLEVRGNTVVVAYASQQHHAERPFIHLRSCTGAAISGNNLDVGLADRQLRLDDCRGSDSDLIT